ncbi:aminomethyl-transferring glycine dehydrogenase subunit GcvPA [Coralloluteibacterium thermophilus]|uniref:Probable glycine dehydrogenase (decarboxylating) subunit 1 n=1 Tax=Coralloluteibacterium thermophilum TaxID=2707049 RepID=A0ABV9NH38_9GAMM
MPFIPHSEDDVRQMLATIGVADIETLFDEIPASLKAKSLTAVPEGLTEMEVSRLMRERARADETVLNFAGAGAYEHHIPAAVWQIVGRGEFYSAYTPYQAEASQGTLQLIYEYQTMLTRLVGMDASNASMYDGATALAEALLMAERSRRKGGARRVLVPESVHPAYRETVRTILDLQQIEVVELPCPGGRLDLEALAAVQGEYTALVVPQPNFFGVLEEADALTDAAHAAGALVVAVVNPMSLALLKPPGEWGGTGADIVCGDGQPLGVPLSSGGPYFGFLACKKELIRNMPGRIVGRTVDVDGRTGYALTLQAREQHIRRAKATSNICTNQGLLVTAATIYMSLLGPQGLQAVAQNSMANLRTLRDRLCAIPGVRPLFADQAHFHEIALRLPRPAREVIETLARQRIVAGVALGDTYAGYEDALLVCATETKTAADIEQFAAALADALA